MVGGIAIFISPDIEESFKAKIDEFVLPKIEEYIRTDKQKKIEQPAVPNEDIELPKEEPVIHYPVSKRDPEFEAKIQTEIEQPSPQPVAGKHSLPAKKEKGSSIKIELGRLLGRDKFDKLFIMESIIYHFVVTIDNLTERTTPNKYRFIKPPKGRFNVRLDSDGNKLLDEYNYRRYTPYIQFAESVDIKKIASIYDRYYTLFQHAYEDLGYPNKYFNDRLVEVIDHLLGAPDFQGRIKLKRPSIYYKFADPEMEARSAGQKILIRIGHNNAMRVKAMLGELRQELTTLSKEEWRQIRQN